MSGRALWSTLLLLVALFAGLGAGGAAAARAPEHIRIGVQKIVASGPIYIALRRGYFAAEGLEPELVYFEAAQPIAVAAAAGDIDFGTTGASAGFYNLAGQGVLRIIAGYLREAPGFPGTAWVVSNRAYEANLKTFHDLPGHALAVTQIGSSVHYAAALLAEKYGFALESLRILPLQTNSNAVAAVVGGQTDAALIPMTFILPALQRGEAHNLGFVGDETPFQLGIAITATRTSNQRRDTVERFLRAYRRGVRDYHDAFTGADGRRQDGPATPEILALLADYVGQPAAMAGAAVVYFDPEARLDVKDIRRQIAWYQSQGMVKGEVHAEDLIDRRYVVPLPER